MSAPDRSSLPDIESHVEMVLRASGPLTQPQIAEKVYGCPIHPTGDAEADTARRSAIRAVQQSIQSLRRRGVPVIDTPHGMTIARTSADVLAEYKRLRSRFLTQAATARSVLRAARRLAEAEANVEQASLWDAIEDAA